MIGTHNSGTGEPSKCWYYEFLIPFARCQRYNIQEQLNHGSKLFDLRVREDGSDYILCHGLWKSKTTLDKALGYIDNQGALNHCKYKVLVTYEGSLSNNLHTIFKTSIIAKLTKYNNVSLVQIAVKKPEWIALYSDNVTSVKQGFKCLDFRSWHTLIPIPWLWSNFYKKIDNSNDTYTLIDFL